jgi:murein DD-endopeptidase MepM/ murein hydrolase activator NlpD
MRRLPLALALAVLSTNVAAAEPSLEGTWRGTLAGTLRLAVTFTRSPDGAYRAILDSLDQGAKIAVDTVKLDGGKVHLELKSIGGSYDGSLNKDETELTGTWTQGGAAQPLTFTRGKPRADDSASSKTQPPLFSPLDVSVPMPPTVFRSGGKTHLVYELHITNLSRRDVSLVRIEALGDGKSSLLRLEGLDLATGTLRPGVDAAGLETLQVGPGLRAVVFLWVTPNAAPSTLEHVITIKVGDVELTTRTRAVPVGKDLVTIGPPLRGGGWLAANGPSDTSAHRRSLLPVDGQATLAQRFAIDWVRVGDDGATFTGAPKENRSYHAYGAEALAVAEGTVTSIKDGIAENVPGDSRAVPMTLETLTGNHVVLDLGHGRFALYAHLQPGSLRVKPGDHVRRGQVLGLVGNSGNSTEPHLHFHLMNASSPLGAEGIPYALKPTNELPAENERVTFP